jgi:hypothetical protein
MKADLVFLPPGLDFVAVGFDFIAADLVLIAVGFDFVVGAEPRPTGSTGCGF